MVSKSHHECCQQQLLSLVERIVEGNVIGMHRVFYSIVHGEDEDSIYRLTRGVRADRRRWGNRYRNKFPQNRDYFLLDRGNHHSIVSPKTEQLFRLPPGFNRTAAPGNGL